MTTFSAPCKITVLDNGIVTVNIRFSSEDEKLLAGIFANKEIDYETSLLDFVCLNDGAVVISGMLKLKNKQQASKARIADVVFRGQCHNCDAVVDISDKLPFEQKKKLVAAFGVELQDDVWTCKHVSNIACCPHCHP